MLIKNMLKRAFWKATCLWNSCEWTDFKCDRNEITRYWNNIHGIEFEVLVIGENCVICP